MFSSFDFYTLLFFEAIRQGVITTHFYGFLRFFRKNRECLVIDFKKLLKISKLYSRLSISSSKFAQNPISISQTLKLLKKLHKI